MYQAAVRKGQTHPPSTGAPALSSGRLQHQAVKWQYRAAGLKTVEGQRHSEAQKTNKKTQQKSQDIYFCWDTSYLEPTRMSFHTDSSHTPRRSENTTAIREKVK